MSRDTWLFAYFFSNVFEHLQLQKDGSYNVITPSKAKLNVVVTPRKEMKLSLRRIPLMTPVKLNVPDPIYSDDPDDESDDPKPKLTEASKPKLDEALKPKLDEAKKKPGVRKRLRHWYVTSEYA